MKTSRDEGFFFPVSLFFYKKKKERNRAVFGAAGSSPDSGQNLKCCVPLKFTIFWLKNLSMSKCLILKLWNWINLWWKRSHVFPSPAEKMAVSLIFAKKWPDNRLLWMFMYVWKVWNALLMHIQLHKCMSAGLHPLSQNSVINSLASLFHSFCAGLYIKLESTTGTAWEAYVGLFPFATSFLIIHIFTSQLDFAW